MPGATQDLHGMAPDKCPAALLLIDVINDLEFEGADRLMRFALPMAKALRDLKKRARERGIPAIYVNDNYGKWRSDFNRLVDRCLESAARGRPIVEMLRPAEDDYFVLKPKHSGFYSTSLEILLDHLNARTLILTGIAGNICILFTANDAYMRGLRLWTPSDCCASIEAEDNDYALRRIATILKGDTRRSTEIDLDRLLAEAEQHSRPDSPFAPPANQANRPPPGPRPE